MLPGENEPFADHHIAELNKVYADLTSILSSFDTDAAVGITRDDIVKDRNRVHNAINAFHRYKACFKDEVRQKEQNRDRILHCRLNHTE